MGFSFSWGKMETHKQNSQEVSRKGRERARGQSRDNPGTNSLSRGNFVYALSSLLVFPGPNKKRVHTVVNLGGVVKTLRLQSEGSGREPENGKFPKVVRRGCKRWFELREQKSPKSLLHHPKPVLHRCNPILHWCNPIFAPWAQKTFCTLS